MMSEKVQIEIICNTIAARMGLLAYVRAYKDDHEQAKSDLQKLLSLLREQTAEEINDLVIDDESKEKYLIDSLRLFDEAAMNVTQRMIQLIKNKD